LNTHKQIVLIVALSFLFVGACAAYSAIDLPLRSPRQSAYFQSESIDRGALLFANNCRTCHGIKGQGGVGLPLNKPDFKNQDPLILVANQALIHTTLFCGRAGTLMPPWLNTNGGSLNTEQIQHLIDLITAPVDPNLKDDEGNPTNAGWLKAVEYAQNLNRAVTVIVGGDGLDAIAKTHQIGLQQLADLNGGAGPNDILPHDMIVKLPPNQAFPNGRDYKVLSTNETLSKIADSQHVGAAILADLNNLPYSLDAKANFSLLGQDGAPIPGLFPGDKLALPDGANYIVKAGDTLDSIATQHGLTAASIHSLNTARIGALQSTDPVDAEGKLKLPAGSFVIAKAGQTLAVIATAHAVKPEDIATANNIAVDVQLSGGEKLLLSASAQWVIQRGDTIQSVALANGVSADALAQANNLKVTDPISPDVVLKLPKVNQFTITGQTLDDIAKAYSNVTADSLGAANSVPANAVLRVAQTLKLPADAWGSAPATFINPGTACVQNAIPQSTFQTLPGVSTPVAAAPVGAPTTVSTSVTLSTGPTDWILTADGTAQDSNKGSVLINKGTVVNFVGKTGLHTITLNGQKNGDNFNAGDTRTITFNTSGTFKLTCDFHPNMLAYIYVQ